MVSKSIQKWTHVLAFHLGKTETYTRDDSGSPKPIRDGNWVVVHFLLLQFSSLGHENRSQFWTSDKRISQYANGGFTPVALRPCSRAFGLPPVIDKYAVLSIIRLLVQLQ